MQELLRTTKSVASKMMLPTYAVVVLLYGWAYLTDPKGNMGTVPGLAAQRHMMGGSMETWGYVFLAVGILMVFSQVTERRFGAALGLALGVSLWTFWGALYVRSALIDPGASVLGPVLPFAWAVAHLASLLSAFDEEQP